MNQTMSPDSSIRPNCELTPIPYSQFPVNTVLKAENSPPPKQYLVSAGSVMVLFN